FGGNARGGGQRGNHPSGGHRGRRQQTPAGGMMTFPSLNLRFLATPATSRKGAQNLAALLILIVVLFLTFSSPRFLTVGNVENLVVQIAPLLLAALGKTVVILTGGLDVSVGAVIGLTTAIVSQPVSAWLSVPLALAVAALVGA